MTFEASPNDSETSNNIHQQGQEQNEDREEPLRPPRRRNLPANANQIGAVAAAVADNQQQQAAEQQQQPTVEESATSANSAAAQQEEEEDETINNIDNEHLEEINFDYDNEELINNDPIFEQLFGNPNQFRGGQSNQPNQNQQAAPNQSNTNQALANLQQQISGLMVGIGERPAIPAGDIVEAECENLDKDIDLINEAMNKLDQQNNLLQSRFRELLMAIVDER